MRKIIFIIFILLIILITIFKVDASYTVFPLLGKTIVLDAGHGLPDFGASVGNVKESEVNLLITLKLKDILEKEGAVVLLTREDENDLADDKALYRKKSDFDRRIKIINNSNADLYLSIHQNIYSNKIYKGPQVFYDSKLKDNEKIAETLQNDLNSFTKNNRKIKIISGTYMYNKLNVKGVLIECGFLSNPDEKSKLLSEDYQKNFVKTITNSIIRYFS